MKKKLLLLLAVILFSFDAIGQCTITGAVNASTLTCSSYSSCSTIYIGDGVTATTLNINTNLDLTCLGPIQFIIRNNATIRFNSDSTLSLPGSSSLVFETGSNLTYTSTCSSSKNILVGGISVANCSGFLSLNTFSGLLTNGGYNVVSATAPPICGSGTSTLTATRIPNLGLPTTYTWYDASNNIVSTSATYNTPVLSATTTYYVEATTAGFITTPRKTVTVAVNSIPAQPTVTITQPTCSTATGTITITTPTATGMTYSINGSTYTNTTGVFTSVAAGTYSVTAKSTEGCISPATSVTVNAQPVTPVKPILSSATTPTCTTMGSFTITNYDPSYTYAVSPAAGVIISGNTITAPGGSYTVTATLGSCTSPVSLTRNVSAQPVTPAQPTLSAVTQPTCSTATGSFTITNYNASYAYTVTPSTGVGISGNTITAPAGTYTVTATLSGCSSTASSSVTVNAQPVTPVKPILSSAINPTCTIPTGSFTITNYDASYTYAVSPSTGVTISGNTITGPAGAYTVTATLGSCTSPVSLIRNINAIPATPATPTIVTIQPNCLSATGTITITNPVAIGMTYSIDGTTYTNSTGVFSNLAPGTYSVTAKSDIGCISSATNVTISPVNTNTWNGTAWSTGSVPSGTETIVFNGNFSSSTDLAGCSCQVNSGNVVINSGHNLTITNGISVLGGSLTFEDSANLVQINDNAVNTGNIIYKRKTTPLKQYDYAYWSAPVANATLSQLATNSLLYAYSPSINNWVQQTGSTTMVIGQGYIGRAPNNLSYATPQIVETSFTGVPNNGTLTTPITKGAGVLNLIGNPYPSAIDIDLFLIDPANAGIVNGTIYLWTHNTAISSSNPGNDIYNYTANDYAKYNITGGVKTASAALTGGVAPTGKIAAGQGFFIDANSFAANGTYSATFKNSMRVSGNNTQFFRTSEAANTNNSTAGSLEKHRVWLSLSNAQGAYNEALVGYIQGATNELDRLFDGKTLPAENVVSVYSLLSNEKLSIQGRGLPFSASDIVPIGYTTTLSGDFRIRLENFDGLFANQDIYLLDKTTGLYHDLKVGAFTFTTTSGTFNNRFELRFTSATLNVSTADNNNSDIRIITEKQHLAVLSGASSIASIEVRDLLGKLIYAKKDIHFNEFYTDTIPAGSQMLIVKVTLDDNKNVTKKVLMP